MSEPSVPESPSLFPGEDGNGGGHHRRKDGDDKKHDHDGDLLRSARRHSLVQTATDSIPVAQRQVLRAAPFRFHKSRL